MRAHPIIDYPYRWLPVLVLALVLAITQAALSWGYAGTNWLPALVDGVTTIGWLAALAYLAWFVVGYVSMFQTNFITIVIGVLLWIAGSFMVCDIMVKIVGIPYISFASTIPFRLLFGIPAWIAVILWYHLLVVKDSMIQEEEFIAPPQEAVAEPEQQEDIIDRITVKDGSRIHIIKVDELLYIQACGDYTTLVTSSGEYIKEQTMKYLEAHLPADNFVRIHRSTIVNVTQISRVELFGKETYQVSLKNGVKLRVSLTGYRLLKERLGI
ncbi:LytTR family DNA-binding domain-containing protein [Bacteroides oleiciplenus]|uniref:LytTR family transcriptional regulator n=1 Tax=Bacteroides oleiciplenus TaxID=626931 RepID=A0A3E5BFY7_9BACE|nr:LytTR family DNA-binding domain-containing protein [Bacteroides oleiciplenus]RGN36512.1 LytTR family transcriptional regulator [Bacteroides oleiciplenus]